MEIEEGDLVQIIDQEHSWFPCVLMVDEVKDWGVQACVIIPNSNGVSRAYNRLKYDQIKKVGFSLFTFGE